MVNIIKKVGISIFTMILVSGIFVAGKSQNVLADVAEFTVNFHYTRSDANYSGYTIKAYSASDSEGKSGEFVVNGKEAVFTYTFARDTEVDEQVNVLIRTEGGAGALEIDSSVNITGVTSNVIDVAIDGDAKTVGIMEASPAEPDSSENAEPVGNSTGEQAENAEPVGNSTGEQAAAVSYEADDPNADYSVGTIKVIIIDVVALALIGGISFVVFGKEKKPVA